VTRDQIRGLIGGYATGTLTEAERRILFDAALQDQELFDDLAREQAIKEALEEPGAKQRLIETLRPKPKSWWKQSWVWAAAGAATVAIAAGIFLTRAGPNQEIARLEPPPAPPGAIAPPVAIAPPPAQPAPVQQVAPTPEIVKQSPAVDAPQGAPLPAPAPPVAGPGAQAFAQGTVGGVPRDTSEAVSTGSLSGAAAGFGGAGGGGGRGGAARAPRAFAPQAAPAPVPAAKVSIPRFAFDYDVSPEGVLKVVPAADGFLTVIPIAATPAQLFSNRPLRSGVATEIQLPADAASVMVIFSARETAGGTVAGTPGDPRSGTKADPSPSLNSSLMATIPLRH
jgi:hypothetical protein